MLLVAASVLLLWQVPGLARSLGVTACAECEKPGAPWLALIGAGYFTALAAFAWCQPATLRIGTAIGGFLFALALPALLWNRFGPPCPICLGSHALHVLFWGVLMTLPAKAGEYKVPFGLTAGIVLACGLSGVSIMASMAALVAPYERRRSELGTLQKGATAPSLAVTDLAGHLILDDDRVLNSDLTIIDFVTPDCAYCARQLPVLDQWAQKLQSKKVVIVAIGVRPTGQIPMEEGARLQTLAPHVPLALDTSRALIRGFGIEVYPTLIFLDRNRKVVDVIIGAPSDLKARLDAAIEATARAR